MLFYCFISRSLSRGRSLSHRFSSYSDLCIIAYLSHFKVRLHLVLKADYTHYYWPIANIRRIGCAEERATWALFCHVVGKTCRHPYQTVPTADESLDDPSSLQPDDIERQFPIGRLTILQHDEDMYLVRCLDLPS